MGRERVMSCRSRRTRRRRGGGYERGHVRGRKGGGVVGIKRRKKNGVEAQ